MFLDCDTRTLAQRVLAGGHTGSDGVRILCTYGIDLVDAIELIKREKPAGEPIHGTRLEMHVARLRRSDPPRPVALLANELAATHGLSYDVALREYHRMSEARVTELMGRKGR